MLLAVALQVTLGILTLKSHVWVPLASTHQMGGVILLTAMTWFCHELWRPKIELGSREFLAKKEA